MCLFPPLNDSYTSAVCLRSQKERTSEQSKRCFNSELFMELKRRWITSDGKQSGRETGWLVWALYWTIIVKREACLLGFLVTPTREEIPAETQGLPVEVQMTYKLKFGVLLKYWSCSLRRTPKPQSFNLSLDQGQSPALCDLLQKCFRLRKFIFLV